MHELIRVSGQPALVEAHPGDGVFPVTSVIRNLLLVEDGNGNSPNGRTGRNALGVPERALYMKVRCTPHF